MTQRRAPSALVALLLLALLATGCAGLPTGGGVVHDNQADPQNGAALRIWPRKPSPGDKQAEIVEGFLQAAASDEPNLTTAHAYLMGKAADSWDLNQVVIVNSNSSKPSPVPGTSDTFQITGTPVGSVNDYGSYQAVGIPQKSVVYQFHVTRDNANGYRIDRLPPGFGVGLSPEEFRSNYANYNLYYLDSTTHGTSMIPVPLYLRANTSDGTLADKLATALLDFPVPGWLSLVAEKADPGATKDSPVTIRQDGTAVVTVKKSKDGAITTQAASRLADQLLASFVSISSVLKVEVDDPAGKEIGRATDVNRILKTYHVTGLGGRQDTAGAYYLETKFQQVYKVDGKLSTPVGPQTAKYSELAVGRSPTTSQPVAAVVDVTKTKLYIGTPGITAVLPVKYTGHDLRSLTWDAVGHLWFIDTDGGQPILHRIDAIDDGQAEKVYVFGSPGNVQQISIAPDGWRIAVTYTDGPNFAVAIGVVERSSTDWMVDLTSGGYQPVVSQWAKITDVDWFTSQILAILGAQLATSPLTIYEMYTDGSPVVNPADLNVIAILPPETTTTIAWTQSGSLLAAATQSINGIPTDEVLEYASSSSSWTERGFGISPSYGK
jgi:hypothetical protein